jgi:hypothetical protein
VIRWCDVSREGRLVYHGSVWRWYRNGKRRSKEFYLDGIGEGEWASWFPNGRQSSLGFYTHGHKAGTWLYWNEAGRVRAEVTYGVNADQWTQYYPSGKKRATGRAIRSGKIGPWVYWDKKGREKARCDFGNGLPELKSDGCRLIAGELEPVGYSTPRPAVTATEADVTLRIEDESYTFAIPAGWQPRAQQQMPVVLEPQEADEHGTGPELQLHILYKNGRKFTRVVAGELTRLRESVARYGENATQREQMKGGRAATTKQISFRPMVEPDSPLSPVAHSIVHQTVTFIDASDRIVIMAVLECHSLRQMKGAAPALTALLEPLREPPPAPPPVQAQAAEAPPPPVPAAPVNTFRGFD